MLSVLIPSSLTIESPDPKIKTYKIGQIARAASIFRVDEIVIYRDREFDDSSFISTVLRYAETPQYLRKKIFPMRNELRYVGVIPPLRTPHHQKKTEINIGDFREGFAEDDGVEIGAEKKAKTKKKIKGRITTRIISKDPLEVEIINKKDIPFYWGYETRVSDELGKTLRKMKSKIVFTSKKGEIARDFWKDVAFVFGPPNRGIDDILGDEGLSYEDFPGSEVLNVIPSQGTETVRTEEAIFVALALYNMWSYETSSFPNRFIY
ncbi:MAG: putative RNA uridine N3 methyltransferase [Candidatus Syntropharchaeia archaeon]